MKKQYMLSGFMMTVLVLCSTTLWANDYKIGFVNTAAILDKAPQAEAVRKLLEKEFSPREQNLVGMQNKIRQMEEKRNRDSSVMNEATAKTLDRDIINQSRELRRLRDEFQEDFNLRRNEEVGKLHKQISKIISVMAKEQNFDLIVSDGVYASDRINLTDTLLKRLENEYRNGGK